MFAKNFIYAFLIIATQVVMVNASYAECQQHYGPVPPKPTPYPTYPPVQKPVPVPVPVRRPVPVQRPVPVRRPVPVQRPVPVRRPVRDDDDRRLNSKGKTKRTLAVDSRCHKYGYYRRTLVESSPYNFATDYNECLDTDYDMYLVIEGAHFAGLATPSSTNTSSAYCPPVVLHATTKKNENMEKLMVVASNYDVERMDEETKYYLGSIVHAFDTAHVGLNGVAKYNPISNNCVAMLRNMADPLDIPLKENEGLIQFISRRLLSDSADHMFEIMEKSPTLKMLYDGSNRLLGAIGSGSGSSLNKKDVVAKLINLYL